MKNLLLYLKIKHKTNKRWVNDVLFGDTTSIHMMEAENEAIERLFKELGESLEHNAETSC